MALLVGIFAVGCAKDFKTAQNVGESSDNQSDLAKSTPNHQTNELPTTTEIAKLFESIGISKSIKSTKSTPKVIPQKIATPKQSVKNIAQDSRKTREIQAQDSQKIQISNTKDLSAIAPQNPKNSSDLQVSGDLRNSHILNQSTPKARFSFNLDKLNAPLPHLQANCDMGDLQKCEDLGRIYAMQDKHDLAVAHYKRACDGGNGLIMPCFFLSLMYANNGDSATSREYLSAISDKLESHKIDEAELLLSIGEIALIKEKLQNFCTNGESTSCNVLLSVFKIRGEDDKAKAFFSAECKRGNKTPCDIANTLH